MSETWLVGIDDTDNEDSIGTGRLARMLAEHLEAARLVSETSVTRHQFLVHPDIPYTSHNSSSCIAGRGDAGVERAIADASSAFLAEHFHEGANPGLCVCAADGVPAALLALAKRAQREVLDLAEFDRALARERIEIRSTGETGQGRIGAASGVALRASGDDGRFIGLRGIRDLDGTLRVDEITARSGVVRVESDAGEALAGDARVRTGGWVRPTLRAGAPVLRVRRDGDDWVPVERRSKDD